MNIIIQDDDGKIWGYMSPINKDADPDYEKIRAEIRNMWLEATEGELDGGEFDEILRTVAKNNNCNFIDLYNNLLLEV